MSTKSKFRIKGLSDLPSNIASTVPVPRMRVAEISAETGQIPWDKAVQAVGIPHLRHYLYQLDLPQLAQLWPTMAFVLSPNSRAIQSTPMALAPYLDGAVEDGGLREIVNEWQDQELELQNLKKIIGLVSGRDEPTSDCYTPIATAFAAAFFRGSQWRRKNHAKLLMRIRTHPVAAFVALKSGVWWEETDQLIQTVSRDPRLLVDLWRSGLWYQSIGPELLQEATESAPHLSSITAFRHIRITRDKVWNDLIEAANEDAMAAAFCLGLDPTHPQADQWIQFIKSSPRAMYWALRLGGWGDDRSKLHYWSEFRRRLWEDPRWGFHFVRDYDSGEAFQWIEKHWPNPWAIELAVELKLPKDWCLARYSELNVDPKSTDPLLVALTLWAADFVTEDVDES
jgi:hypothetical protein